MEGFVDLPDGTSIHYEDVGEGPVVALLHPGLWDMRTWDLQVPTFVGDGYRVVRYDLRGYGRSSRPVPGDPYSHVKDLWHVLDHVGAGEVALVGCSMGGRIAIDATLTEPDRVWALVPVTAGVSGFEPSTEEDDWWDDAMAPAHEAWEAGDMARAQRERLAIWAPLGLDDEAGAAIEGIAMDNLHELTMDESAEVALDPPAVTRLHEIDVPTLVVKAEHDPPFSRRASDLIAAGVVEGRIVQLDGADHVANLRRPEAFDAVVLPFLREVAP